MKKIIILFVFLLNSIVFAEINNIEFQIKEKKNILLNNKIIENINTLDEFSTVTLNKVLDIKPIPFYKFYKKNIFEIDDLIKVENRLNEYLNSLGFYNKVISKEFKKNTIIFKIVLNEQIKINSIQIDTEYKNLLKLKEKEGFSTIKFSESKNQIKRYFNEMGYLNALLDAKAYVNIEDYKVDLVFQINKNKRNKIKNILIKNNANINNDLIKKQLTFKEKDFVDIRQTEKSFSNLYQYGIFSKIKIEPKNIQNNNNEKDILIVTEEGKNKFIKTILGYNNDEKFNIAAYWGNNNYYGDLKKIETGFRLSEISKELYLKGSVPFVDVPLVGETDFHNKIELDEYIYDTYKEQTIKNNFYIQKDFIIDNQIGFLTELSKIENNINSNEYISENDRYFINSIFYKGVLDKRDSKIKPKNGVYFSFYFENSSDKIGSDIEYNKFLTDFRIMKNIYDFTFYYKNRVGMIDQDVPLFKKFYTGGIFTNRGYDYLSVGETENGVPIGGLSLLENMFEVDYSLNSSIDFALFYDDSLLSNKRFDFGNEHYSAYGIGIRYNTKIGPIRLDTAIPNQTNNDFKINLSIGLSF